MAANCGISVADCDQKKAEVANSTPDKPEKIMETYDSALTCLETDNPKHKETPMQIYGSDISSDDTENRTSNSSLASAFIKNDGKSNSAETRKLHKKEYANGLKMILKDARFFLMKSDNIENISLSKSQNVWSTPPKNEETINQALKEIPNVLLIFSANESGKFSGFARLISESSTSGPSVNWTLPPTLKRKTLGMFPIEWISKNDLPFHKTKHLFNPWNEGKPVKIGRDGQEIEPHVGLELCRLFPMDSTTNWTSVLNRSKEATKINHTKVNFPMRYHRRSNPGIRFRESRVTKERYSNIHRNSRRFEYGRDSQRRYPDGKDRSVPKKIERGHEFHNRRYNDRRQRMMNNPYQYGMERSSDGRSATHLQRYPKKSYYHTSLSPPAPPSYPPPSLFANILDFPGYYSGLTRLTTTTSDLFQSCNSDGRKQRATDAGNDKSTTNVLQMRKDWYNQTDYYDRERDINRKFYL